MAATDLFRYSPRPVGDHDDDFDESESSNEDTDEASEHDHSPSRKFDAGPKAYTEIKEQMYQVKYYDRRAVWLFS